MVLTLIRKRHRDRVERSIHAHFVHLLERWRKERLKRSLKEGLTASLTRREWLRDRELQLALREQRVGPQRPSQCPLPPCPHGVRKEGRASSQEGKQNLRFTLF